MKYIKEFLKLPKEEQALAINHVATVKGLPALAVEKDLWVTVVLHLLFGGDGPDGLVFKGGTSLSKGFDIIQRFSEDIDITLKTSLLENYYGPFDFDNPLTDWNENWSGHKVKKSLEKLQILSQKYTDEILLDYLQGALGTLVSTEVSVKSEGEMTLNIYYPKVLKNDVYGGEYIYPVVKVELGVRSTPEPRITQHIDSFIENVRGKTDPVEVTILRPDRTFWEKVTILHAENSRNDPKRIQRHNRMSRHLYDIVKLADSKYGDKALSGRELLDIVVQHKRVFFKDNKARYEEAIPEKLRLVPQGEMLKQFKEDYEEMAEVMFSSEAPPFDEIMERLKEVEAIIRKM